MPRGEVAQALSNLLYLIDGGAPPGLIPATLIRIIDGDTLEVTLEGKTETVRLIGIDAPEAGEPYSTQAADALESMFAGQEIHLEFDVEERDQYGRVLAYVYASDGNYYQMAQEPLLIYGLAAAYTVPPNVAYAETFEFMQDLAQSWSQGMWEGLAPPPLELVDVHYDAAGDDNQNLNDEWLELRVLLSGSLVGYAVEDETGHRYKFPDRVFQEGQTFRLYTGSGTDSQSALYWGSASAVWDNDGEAIYVRDAQGYVRLLEYYY
jgi:micrococcal nuclease